ncbi:MAG: LysR family transcriptional regulator [Candidatus Krumholzibacteria bacterium]|jgi:molybdate transport system regulatory protein|nr:LysR family transcriptional regulator [Candidatus Krumholzibacteria bacterium]
MKPSARLFIVEDENGGFFGDGRCELLKAVMEHGSLSGAAEALGRGYRKAWADIRKAEEATGLKLVVRERGGARGGSSKLTESGERLVRAWERYSGEVALCMSRAYGIHLRDVIEGGVDGSGEDEGDA